VVLVAIFHNVLVIILEALQIVNGNLCNVGALQVIVGVLMRMEKKLKVLVCLHGKDILIAKSIAKIASMEK
jgi:hypothetical protein